MDDDDRLPQPDPTDDHPLGPGANTGDAKPEDWETDLAASPDDEELKRVKGG